LKELPLYADCADTPSRDAIIVMDIIKGMEAGEAKDQIVDAYADTLRVFWASLIAMVAAAFLLSLPVGGYTLDQVRESQQVFVGSDGVGATTEGETDIGKKGGERSGSNSAGGLLGRNRTIVESGQVVEQK
jgi:hypothetical protein